MPIIPPEDNGDIPSEDKGQPNLPRGGLSDVQWQEFEDWFYHGADLRLDGPEDLTPEELQREISKFHEEKQHGETPKMGVSENIAGQREATGKKAQDIAGEAAGEGGIQFLMSDGNPADPPLVAEYVRWRDQKFIPPLPDGWTRDNQQNLFQEFLEERSLGGAATEPWNNTAGSGEQSRPQAQRPDTLAERHEGYYQELMRLRSHAERVAGIGFYLDRGLITEDIAEIFRDRLRHEPQEAVAEADDSRSESGDGYAVETPAAGTPAILAAAKQKKQKKSLYRRYRESRQRWKQLGHTIDHGVRGTVTGGVVGGITGLTALQGFQNLLGVGGAMGSGFANVVCMGLPAAPLLYRPACWVYAKRKHEDIKIAYDQCTKDSLHLDGVPLEEHQRVFQREINQPTVELIDQPGEQEFIKAFHMVIRDRLANIPHLLTEERYAQYCFTVMVEACKNSAAKEENARNGAEKILANYHPFDTAGNRLPDAAERILHMRQISITYGKMLAERERQEGESQITGAIVGASIALLFTYGPLAPIIGGIAWTGRRLWCRHKEAQVHIEVNERNELVGKEGQPIYNPTTYRSDVVSLYRNGDFVTQAEDEAKRKEWREEEGGKSWLKSIVIPAESVQRCRTGAIKTPRGLALETAPRVQEQLKNQRIEHRPPVNTSKVREIEMQIEAETEDLKNLRAQRSPSKDALDQCAARLKELRKALSAEKNPKPRSGPDGVILPLTIEEIGKNVDAGKAFAIAVVETFQANAKQGWVRKKTGEALAPVGSAFKEAAIDVVVKPVIVGGLSVGGVFLAGKLIGVLGGITVSTPVTLTIGGAVGIYALVRMAASAIKDFKWGKGAHTEKKEPDKK